MLWDLGFRGASEKEGPYNQDMQFLVEGLGLILGLRVIRVLRVFRVFRGFRV